MQNPFETGHIKNYVLLYVSVVVIMVLFFIATSLFHDVKPYNKRVFKTDSMITKKTKEVKKTNRFKLLKTDY
jgi:hypothetical protein